MSQKPPGRSIRNRPPRVPHSVVSCLAVIVFCMAPDNSCAQAERSEVLEAWKARQESTQSIMYDMKGTLSSPFVMDGQSLMVGDRNERSDIEVSLVIQGDNARLHERSPLLSRGTKGVVSRDRIMTFDGTAIRTWNSANGLPIPASVVGPASRSEIGELGSIVPLLLVFFPFHPDFGELRENEVTVIGAPYRRGDEVVSQVRHGDWLFLVNADRQYVPVHGERRREGRLTSQLEIQYVLEGSDRWLPNAWTVTNYRQNGEVGMEWEVKASSFTVNGTVPDDTFTLEIPAGTYVNDQLEDKRYVTLEGGGRRYIERGELTRENLDSVLKRAAGENGQTETVWSGRALVMLAILVGLVAICVGTLRCVSFLRSSSSTH
jgi:hypothetical protein